MSSSPSVMKSRISLIVLIAIFVVPIIVAKMQYRHAVEHGVTATTNLGEFIQPPQKIENLNEELTLLPISAEPNFTDKWGVLLHLHECAAECPAVIQLFQNFRISFNKDYFKIEPVAVIPESHTLTSEQINAAAADVTLATAVNPAVFQRPGTYIVDPDGFAMMFYEGEFDPAVVKKDLRKLLHRRQK